MVVGTRTPTHFKFLEHFQQRAGRKKTQGKMCLSAHFRSMGLERCGFGEDLALGSLGRERISRNISGAQTRDGDLAAASGEAGPVHAQDLLQPSWVLHRGLPMRLGKQYLLSLIGAEEARGPIWQSEPVRHSAQRH